MPILLGRVTLVLAPLVWAASYLVGCRWAESAGNHLSAALVVLGSILALLWPLLLVPVGSVEHASIDDRGVLTITTVLGRRRIDLNALRRVGAGTVWIEHAYGPYYVLYLRSSLTRWVFVWLGSSPRLPTHVAIRGELREIITSLADRRPDAVSPRARARFGIGDPVGPAERFVLGTITVLVVGVASMAWIALLVTIILVGCDALAT